MIAAGALHRLVARHEAITGRMVDEQPYGTSSLSWLRPCGATAAAGVRPAGPSRRARACAGEHARGLRASRLSIGVTHARARSRDDQGRRAGRQPRPPPQSGSHARAGRQVPRGARGPAIRTLTLAELQRYDVGRLKPGSAYAAAFPEQRRPTARAFRRLTELFDLVRRGADHVRFNIETKITPTSGAETPDPETFAAAVATADARGRA